MSHMSYREIERKCRVLDNLSYSVVEQRIMDIVNIPKEFVLTAQTIDEYWLVPGNGDYVRLRNSWGRTLAGGRRTLKELTVKKKDKGSNLDRLEINAAVESVLDTRALVKMVLGKAIGRIDKIETVWFCPEDLVVSLCAINKTDTFVEVEGRSVQQVTAWLEKLKPVCATEVEEKSLFELYISEDVAND